MAAVPGVKPAVENTAYPLTNVSGDCGALSTTIVTSPVGTAKPGGRVAMTVTIWLMWRLAPSLVVGDETRQRMIWSRCNESGHAYVIHLGRLGCEQGVRGAARS